MGIAMMEPSLPIWMKKIMGAEEWQQGKYILFSVGHKYSACLIKCIFQVQNIILFSLIAKHFTLLHTAKTIKSMLRQKAI